MTKTNAVRLLEAADIKFNIYEYETAEMYDNIIVSCGRIGLQVELAPKDLARITSTVFCDLI